MLKQILLISLVLILAACANNPDSTPAPPSPTASPIIPTLESPFSGAERAQIEAQYELLHVLKDEIGAVWSALDANETAQCGATYEALRPEEVSTGSLENELREAAIALSVMLELWKNECDVPRAQVPRSTINLALSQLERAENALQIIEAALSSP